MILLILIFGGLITIAGVLLLVRPSLVLGLMESHGDRAWFYAAAIGMRLVLGLLLVQQAAHSRFPLIIEILGWIALAAALFLAVLGRPRFERFVHWIIGKTKPLAPIGGLLAIVFGLFLIYAFVSVV